MKHIKRFWRGIVLLKYLWLYILFLIGLMYLPLAASSVIIISSAMIFLIAGIYKVGKMDEEGND